MLQTLTQGLNILPNPQLVTFQYEAKVPGQWQWQAGVQRALPWAMAIDLSYVGNHGFNRMGGLQGGNVINLNSIDLGTAYLAKYQDPTKAPSTVPGATALTTNLLRPYQGLANINQNTTEFWDTYHSLQASLNRRFRNGFSFGANYTYWDFVQGQHRPADPLQHAADGTFSLRDDQAADEKLNETLDRRPHSLKANAVWDLPNVTSHGQGASARSSTTGDSRAFSPRAPASLRPELQLSEQRRQRELDRFARLRRPHRLRRRSRAAAARATSTSSSTPSPSPVRPTTAPGWSRAATSCGAAPTTAWTSRSRATSAWAATDSFSSASTSFNLFNTVVINGRQNQIQFVSPTDLTIRNSQTLADGSNDPARLVPRNAGFGAANARACRSAACSCSSASRSS